MARPTDDIQWSADGSTDALEPLLAKKLEGWLPGFRLPRKWLNWFMRAYYRWIAWLDVMRAAIFKDQAWENGSTWQPAYGYDLTTLFNAINASTDATIVAVGSTGTNRVATSADGGLSWTPQSASQANTWTGVAFSPSGFIWAAVASDGANRVMTSTTGSAWTNRTAAAANSWRGICYGGNWPGAGFPDRFVAVSSDGTDRVMQTLTPTSTWSSVTSVPARAWRAVCAASGIAKFVAVSSDGYAMYSNTGTSGWTEVAIGGSRAFVAVAWAEDPGVLCAVSSDGYYSLSADGITWTTPVSMSGSGLASAGSVAWSNDLRAFVIGGIGASINVIGILTVSDASPTTIDDLRILTTITGIANAITWSSRHRRFIAVGQNSGGTQGVITSSRGGDRFTASRVLGTQTNDSAATGCIGEYVSAAIASGSAASAVSTGTGFNITSISLTAGDWDVSGLVVGTINGATATWFQGSVSTSTGTVGTLGDATGESPAPTTAASVSVTLPAVRISLASTTTVYLVARFAFSAGTPKAFGRISARRVR